jgi:phage FluMu protein Com
MVDVRCKGCNKLLAKANSMNAAIKCPSCRMIFEYQVFSDLTVIGSYDILHSETKESKTQ